MSPFKRDELPAGRTDRERVRAMTDAEKRAIAQSDPDNPLWTREAFEEAELILPNGSKKVHISLRVDQDVLDYLKAQGPRYQTRINSLLASYAEGRLIPVDADVVAYFQSTCADYVAHINALLREQVRKERRTHAGPRESPFLRVGSAHAKVEWRDSGARVGAVLSTSSRVAV